MLIPVILSGGSGTRLWPLSRELYPKQLLPLVGDRTMLQDTPARLTGLDAVGPPSAWEHHGMGGDAKGQPVQSNRPSHGSSPILIRRVTVETAQGQWSETVTDAWGDAENPMRAADVVAKYRRLAAWGGVAVVASVEGWGAGLGAGAGWRAPCRTRPWK